ncbi:hypothetical protein GCM10025875_30610 [Litorihabitans aurantiacus]|uniref:Inositol-3-phosphate synthase n=2 Tax=Litorihabitans aurantiacus TaxID=1930061 RepID=A0AA38CV04_9MICO|nr:hypothetical protein GCM10025875_30610 [Litorihabitans aurantiacus]
MTFRCIDPETREVAAVARRRSDVLDLAILGRLASGPLHGYELRKRLAATLGPFRSLSFGSLYPRLRALQQVGWITSADTADLPHALASKRSRVSYELTAAGKEHLAQALTASDPAAWDDDVFDVRFSMFGATDPQTRLRILEGRRTRVLERREATRAAAARNRERRDSYTAELQRHGLEILDTEVGWLERLIATERAATSSTTPPTTARPPVAADEPAGSPPPEPPPEGEPMSSIRVAIAGVGNCASSLVQGVEYYKDADPSSKVPGLMHVQFGEYHVGDLEFVAAFDVDAKKVGQDLSAAIVSSENNTIKISDVPPSGVQVQRGPTLDGLGKYYRETIEESTDEVVDVVSVLRETQADVLVCYLPVGSEDAAKFYAQAAIDAGVAFVNALPVFIAGTPEWADKFTAAGVPIVGDDIKSQVGATITHRVLARLFEDRGVILDRTYQLNVGGNMDFKNMLERDRLESKKISKTQAVTSNLTDAAFAGKTEDRNVHIGPSDYVAWLDDRKWAYVRMEGRAFGDAPLNMEYKLEVWDSPNSAGVIIDAVRAAKIAKDRGVGGPITSASAYFMKSPPEQIEDGAARRQLEAFIAGDVER